MSVEMMLEYTWLLYLLLTHLAWSGLRGLHGLCQLVLWGLNGTSASITANYKDDSYKGSLQVLNIIFRYKFDPLGQASGPSNFLASHKCFVDPEYVLDDHVTLFYVNKTEAIWVEVEKGVDPSQSPYSAFFYFAQWKLAKKLIIMPIHVFHKLGDKVGKPKAKIVFLSNTARCGSTLVTRVFSEREMCIAYSEPDCLNAITQLKGVVPDSDRNRIFKHCIHLLCKPVQTRTIKSFVLKLTQPTMIELPYINKLFPHSYNLFLYRDGLAAAKSIAKIRHTIPMGMIAFILGHWSSTLTKKMMEQMGLCSENFEVKLMTNIHFGVIMWAGAVRQYLDLKEQGMEIVAIRFDDIVKNPQFAFQKIFEYCDFEPDAKAVEVGMSEDSQRGSPLSHANMKKYKSDEYTDEVKAHSDKVCDQFKVPGLTEPFIAPDTITSYTD